MEEENEVRILEEYDSQLWSCSNCGCGLCVEGCPAYREIKNESVTARGLAQIELSLLHGELNISDLSDEIFFSCTGCRWCETICSMNTPLYIKTKGTRETRVSGATMAEKLRSMKILAGGEMPRDVRNAMMSLAKYGNPYGVGESAKDRWVASLGLSLTNQETILYAGATVPYDDSSKKMAEAVIHCLRIGGINLGMLGSRERESGAFARMMGEEWLFAEMMQHNRDVFQNQAIKSIICVSPHDYDAFVHYYSDMEGIEIKHYTQILGDMIQKRKLVPTKTVNKKVVYHDPCYLGRQNNIYEEPRKILRSIPGVTLVETERSGETSYCCGGGGTGLSLELPNEHMHKSRVDQLKEVEPDIIAVACPNCYQMLDSAVKSRNYAIEVKDIAELLREAL